MIFHTITVSLSKFSNHYKVIFTWNTSSELILHSTCAPSTAIQVVDAIEKFNQSYKTDLKCGIGIATGNGYVGNIGNVNSRVQSYFGEALKTSKALADMCQMFYAKILINQTIQSKISDEYYTKPIYYLSINGKNEKCYELCESSNIKSDEW